MKFLFFLLFCSSLSATDPKRILVGSPIRQHPEVLYEFLSSLVDLEKNTYTLDYCFVDDNVNSSSKTLLEEFRNNHPCLILAPDSPAENAPYISHLWTIETIWKVAHFKDRIIQHAIDQKYDYLFLIDSDLVLHPHTVEQLLAANKGIVCNIFWTSWQPGTIEMPQVWLQDEYNFYEIVHDKRPTQNEVNILARKFMEQLRVPGTYEVGGMGACTLIDRETLLKGVSFKKIKNVSFWGEDRHFCIRAAALGIPLFVDTHYPAYHIYRPEALVGLPDFKAKNKLCVE